jgi:hypothetical protein
MATEKSERNEEAIAASVESLCWDVEFSLQDSCLNRCARSARAELLPFSLNSACEYLNLRLPPPRKSSTPAQTSFLELETYYGIFSRYQFRQLFYASVFFKTSELEAPCATPHFRKYKPQISHNTVAIMAHHQRHGGNRGKVLLPPINFIFRCLQQQTPCSIWLYEQLSMRIEGKIRVRFTPLIDHSHGHFRLTWSYRDSMSS